MTTRRTRSAPIILSLIALSGCAALIGFEDYDGPPQTTAGGAGPSATGSGGGGVSCQPGLASPCYEGPLGTEGVGICKPGFHVCKPDGQSFGPCVEAVTPAVEDCVTQTKDENCDGAPVCTGAPVWTEHLGGTADQAGYGVAVDRDGNVVLTGYFEGSVDFGHGKLESAGGWDIFVAKFDAAGKALWSKGFGGPLDDFGFGIATDADGNILVTGSFQGDADFGGVPLKGAGAPDIFALKLDPSGKTLWRKGFGDAGVQKGFGLAVDPAGNVILTGYFEGSIDFGDGEEWSAGGHDLYVAKLDPSGACAWSRGFGDTAEQVGYAVAVDGAGNVLVTGWFAGTLDFGKGSLPSAGGTDAFVAKLSSSGKPLWSKAYGSMGQDTGGGIAVDGAGNALLVGFFNDTVDFGKGPVMSAGEVDAFVMKIDPAGTTMWSRAIGGAKTDYIGGVGVDGGGNTLLAGSMGGDVDFGKGLLMNAGGSDVFVVKLDSSGATLWSKRSGDANLQTGYAVAADSTGNVLATGYFTGVVDFGTDSLSSEGEGDAFLVKLAP